MPRVRTVAFQRATPLASLASLAAAAAVPSSAPPSAVATPVAAAAQPAGTPAWFYLQSASQQRAAISRDLDGLDGTPRVATPAPIPADAHIPATADEDAGAAEAPLSASASLAAAATAAAAYTAATTAAAVAKKRGPKPCSPAHAEEAPSTPLASASAAAVDATMRVPRTPFSGPAPPPLRQPVPQPLPLPRDALAPVGRGGARAELSHPTGSADTDATAAAAAAAAVDGHAGAGGGGGTGLRSRRARLSQAVTRADGASHWQQQQQVQRETFLPPAAPPCLPPSSSSAAAAAAAAAIGVRMRRSSFATGPSSQHLRGSAGNVSGRVPPRLPVPLYTQQPAPSAASATGDDGGKIEGAQPVPESAGFAVAAEAAVAACALSRQQQRALAAAAVAADAVGAATARAATETDAPLNSDVKAPTTPAPTPAPVSESETITENAAPLPKAPEAPLGAPLVVSLQGPPPPPVRSRARARTSGSTAAKAKTARVQSLGAGGKTSLLEALSDASDDDGAAAASVSPPSPDQRVSTRVRVRTPPPWPSLPGSSFGLHRGSGLDQQQQQQQQQTLLLQRWALVATPSAAAAPSSRGVVSMNKSTSRVLKDRPLLPLWSVGFPHPYTDSPGKGGGSLLLPRPSLALQESVCLRAHPLPHLPLPLAVSKGGQEKEELVGLIAVARTRVQALALAPAARRAMSDIAAGERGMRSVERFSYENDCRPVRAAAAVAAAAAALVVRPAFTSASALAGAGIGSAQGSLEETATVPILPLPLLAPPEAAALSATAVPTLSMVPLNPPRARESWLIPLAPSVPVVPVARVPRRPVWRDDVRSVSASFLLPHDASQALLQAPSPLSASPSSGRVEKDTWRAAAVGALKQEALQPALSLSQEVPVGAELTLLPLPLPLPMLPPRAAERGLGRALTAAVSSLVETAREELLLPRSLRRALGVSSTPALCPRSPAAAHGLRLLPRAPLDADEAGKWRAEAEARGAAGVKQALLQWRHSVASTTTTTASAACVPLLVLPLVATSGDQAPSGSTPSSAAAVTNAALAAGGCSEWLSAILPPPPHYGAGRARHYALLQRPVRMSQVQRSVLISAPDAPAPASSPSTVPEPAPESEPEPSHGPAEDAPADHTPVSAVARLSGGAVGWARTRAPESLSASASTSGSAPSTLTDAAVAKLAAAAAARSKVTKKSTKKAAPAPRAARGPPVEKTAEEIAAARALSAALLARASTAAAAATAGGGGRGKKVLLGAKRAAVKSKGPLYKRRKPAAVATSSSVEALDTNADACAQGKPEAAELAEPEDEEEDEDDEEGHDDVWWALPPLPSSLDSGVSTSRYSAWLRLLQESLFARTRPALLVAVTAASAVPFAALPPLVDSLHAPSQRKLLANSAGKLLAMLLPPRPPAAAAAAATTADTLALFAATASVAAAVTGRCLSAVTRTAHEYPPPRFQPPVVGEIAQAAAVASLQVRARAQRGQLSQPSLYQLPAPTAAVSLDTANARTRTCSRADCRRCALLSRPRPRTMGRHSVVLDGNDDEDDEECEVTDADVTAALISSHVIMRGPTVAESVAEAAARALAVEGPYVPVCYIDDDEDDDGLQQQQHWGQQKQHDENRYQQHQQHQHQHQQHQQQQHQQQHEQGQRWEHQQQQQQQQQAWDATPRFVQNQHDARTVKPEPSSFTPSAGVGAAAGMYDGSETPRVATDPRRRAHGHFDPNGHPHGHPHSRGHSHSNSQWSGTPFPGTPYSGAPYTPRDPYTAGVQAGVKRPHPGGGYHQQQYGQQQHWEQRHHWHQQQQQQQGWQDAHATPRPPSAYSHHARQQQQHQQQHQHQQHQQHYYQPQQQQHTLRPSLNPTHPFQQHQHQQHQQVPMSPLLPPFAARSLRGSGLAAANFAKPQQQQQQQQQRARPAWQP